uniref:FH2 domain-containing protein n=1 Tax=Syphacia muris TaxID=451379 RepID=A0A0N5AYN2_9BILA
MIAEKFLHNKYQQFFEQIFGITPYEFHFLLQCLNSVVYDTAATWENPFQMRKPLKQVNDSLPIGLDELSEEERDQIMAKLACARIDAEQGLNTAVAPPTTHPTISTSRTANSLTTAIEFNKSKSLSTIADRKPLTTDDEIKQKKVSPEVSTPAEIMKPVNTEVSTRREKVPEDKVISQQAMPVSDKSIDGTFFRISGRDELAKSLADLLPEEREKILAVMRNAEQEQLGTVGTTTPTAASADKTNKTYSVTSSLAAVEDSKSIPKLEKQIEEFVEEKIDVQQPTTEVMSEDTASNVEKPVEVRKEDSGFASDVFESQFSTSPVSTDDVSVNRRDSGYAVSGGSNNDFEYDTGENVQDVKLHSAEDEISEDSDIAKDSSADSNDVFYLKKSPNYTPEQPDDNDFDYTYRDDRRFIDASEEEKDYVDKNPDQSNHVYDTNSATKWEESESPKWSGQKPMWTTVFAEEEEKSEPQDNLEYKGDEEIMDYTTGSNMLVHPDLDSSGNETVPAFPFNDTTATTYQKPTNVNLDNEDDDKDYPLTNSSQPMALLKQAPATLQLDRTEVKDEDSIKSPPSITITSYDDKKRLSDEESDGETSPSTDEDDYPDQIIEAPTAPATSFDEVEREQEKQEEMEKSVLKQIQAFGESANDEFDVRWAQDSLNKTAAAKSDEEEDQGAVVLSNNSKNGSLESVRSSSTDNTLNTSSRINPFLTDGNTVDGDSWKNPDDIVTVSNTLMKFILYAMPISVFCLSVEIDEIDYNAAVNYFANKPYRPGPVYTIIEDEERSDGYVDTEAKYHGN